MNSYLSKIGYHGPNTLLVLIIIMLLMNKEDQTIYLIGIVIIWQICSHLLNITIKNTLRYPRPDSHKVENFHELVPNALNYLTIHRNFGMPSGHAQAVISEITFIALYFKNPYLLVASAIQSVITLYQRYATQRHSIKQLATGSIIGVMVGIVFYKIVLNYIEKSQNNKTINPINPINPINSIKLVQTIASNSDSDSDSDSGTRGGG
mgnify:CR=1 FL=1